MGLIGGLLRRLVGAPTGTVTRAAYLDGCQFRVSEDRTRVEVMIPGTVILVDVDDNSRHPRSNQWLGVSDVGNMWSEFEVYDPLCRRRSLYLGDSSSYSTARVYANLLAKLDRGGARLWSEHSLYTAS